MTVESAKTVGIAISLQRKHLKLSQQALADAAGVDRAAVSQLERAREDTALFRVVLAVVNALDIDLELRSRDWTPEGPHAPDPQTSIVELGLTLDTLDRLQAANVYDVGQLGSASELIRRPGLSKGTELYELVRVLNRRGLSLPVNRRQRVPGEREIEMFRLRAVEGLSLEAIAERFGIKSERVRQILSYSFGLRGRPPAAKEHKRTSRANRDGEAPLDWLTPFGNRRCLTVVRIVPVHEIDEGDGLPLDQTATAKAHAWGARRLTRKVRLRVRSRVQPRVRLRVRSRVLPRFAALPGFACPRAVFSAGGVCEKSMSVGNWCPLWHVSRELRFSPVGADRVVASRRLLVCLARLVRFGPASAQHSGPWLGRSEACMRTGDTPRRRRRTSTATRLESSRGSR